MTQEFESGMVDAQRWRSSWIRSHQNANFGSLHFDPHYSFSHSEHTAMDEIKFQENCGRQSFYISLENQDTITKEGTPQLSRQKLSKDHVTYIHFVIHYEQHWAAVQIPISPFSIQGFPGQKFYSCHFHYTLCCQTSSKTGPSIDLISTVVQRIFDAQFRPIDWDFSIKDWYVFKALTLY
jgi:hypothetical protein